MIEIEFHQLEDTMTMLDFDEKYYFLSYKY